MEANHKALAKAFTCASAWRFVKRKDWYNMPVNLKGWKDLGLKTSGLGAKRKGKT